jgi:hypothetical protein
MTQEKEETVGTHLVEGDFIEAPCPTYKRGKSPYCHSYVYVPAYKPPIPIALNARIKHK